MAFDFDTNLLLPEDLDFFASAELELSSPQQEGELAAVYVALRQAREVKVAGDARTVALGLLATGAVTLFDEAVDRIGTAVSVLDRKAGVGISRFRRDVRQRVKFGAGVR